jgi:hypothetical protein
MTLTIWEVEEYTEYVPFNPSYWEQIRDGFMSSLRSIGRFFMGLFRWLVVSAPVLVVLAVIALIAFIVIRRKIRAYMKKRADMPPKATAYPTSPMYPSQAYVYPPSTPVYPQSEPPAQPLPTENPSSEQASSEQSEVAE